MKTTLLTLGLTVAMTGLTARATILFNPIPLSPGSFNFDAVVEKTAAPPYQALYTASMDAGTNVFGLNSGGGNGGNNATFYEIGAGGTSGTGVPYHGTTFTAKNDANHVFVMPADYTVPNAVFVGGAGTVAVQVPSGTLTVTTPAAFSKLSFLAAAGNGPASVNYVVHYQDGNSDPGTVTVPDWFTTTAIYTNISAYVANGEFRGSDGTFQQVNTSPQTIRLFFIDIPLSFPASLVTSVDIIYGSPNSSRAAFFGLSGSTDGTHFTPMPVGGFNYDMIIEASLPFTVTATVDSGTNLSGNTWYEQGFALTSPVNATTGLPHPGTTFTALSNANISFKMPASYTKTNNAQMINVQLPANTLTFTTPASYSNLTFLEAAGNGPLTNNYTVHHADTTTETGTLAAPDWFNNVATNVAFLAKGRADIRGMGVINNALITTGAKLFYDTIALTNSSAVTSIDFAYVGGGRTTTFAISGDSSGGGTFAPVAFTGFNVDAVIEASETTNIQDRFYTTATVDGGTNNNANTFYEQGWNPMAPLSGLPPAGSLITSTNLPDHQYQFAPSYTGPNSLYCDSNNPVANVTFANPTNFSAVSFLSADGNGSIQVQVILNHAGGAPSETNTFVSKDWFNGVPAAFTSNGRLNSDSRGANNYIQPGTTGNPRLYEAQFALSDTVHNVTGATLKWTTNNGAGGASSATSRFFIFAVSGSLGAVPPIISGQPTGTNTYEPTNVVLSAAGSAGTNTVTYQWQTGTIGSGIWNNVSNGGDISGATSPTLSITGSSWTNSGDYRCLVSDVAGSTPTITATVNVFSALPDITSQSDFLTEFGNAASDPAAETVHHAIDRLVGADPGSWLTPGQNPSGPFTGPVGYTVTPVAGPTVASAVRLYTGPGGVQNDPADFMLEGSNNGGGTWNTITSGGLNLPAARNNAASAAINPLIQAVQEVHFANTTAYSTYRVTFNNVKTNSVATNGLQIGEVELLGGLASVAPTIAVNPPASVTVFVGGSPTFSVVGTGPAPLTYQWLVNNVSAGASGTNASFTLSNAQLSDSGKTFKCTVTDPFGSTTSSSATLTVVAKPTILYATTVIADNPIAYWRLDESEVGGGDNGVVANDYIGGHDGVYTNVVLGEPGYSTFDTDTSVGVGLLNTNQSAVTGIQGINLAKPTNFDGTISVEAWTYADQPSLYQQINGAGIVTLGYGGGGEQFALDSGGTSNSFRFYFRDAGGASHTVNASSPSANAKWHHVVGVLDGPNGKEYLWVDGQLAQLTLLTNGLGVLADNYPSNRFTIGWRNGNSSDPSLTPLQFSGQIDEVSVYNYALSSNQVQNHYLASGVAPILIIAPTNTPASAGGTATLTSQAYGTAALAYQWYNSDGSNPTTPLPGQTSANLVFANAACGLNGNQYQVVVTNHYGAVTSSPVTLSVYCAAPVILTDLQSQYFVYGGSPLVMSVAAYGQAPLSYQWMYNSNPLSDGGRITGSHTSTLTISAAQVADGGTYQVVISNGSGSTPSAVATVTVLPAAVFNGLGVGWTLNRNAASAANGNGYISSNLLQLTSNSGSPAGGEASSSFFNFPVYIGSFHASYTYQDVGGAGADGTAFVVQTDTRGASALGGAGGSLGYSGITPSVALEFNIYVNNTVGYAFRQNGATGTPYVAAGTVNLASGNPINVDLVYANGSLTAKFTDSVTLATFTTTTNINIPSAVGTNQAYVGFTGANGGTTSIQQISQFVFISTIGLSVQTVGNTLHITWPLAVGGYVLQQSPSLANPTWTPVSASVNVVAGMNEVDVPMSGTGTYYRLGLAVPAH